MQRIFIVTLLICSIFWAQPLGVTSPVWAQADHSKLAKPIATSFYPERTPAGNNPVLTWTGTPGAVSYEIEFLSRKPENPNGIDASRYEVQASRSVFTNGYTADLAAYPGNYIYWRVRGLDVDGKALGVFSDAQKIVIDHGKREVLKPRITAQLNADNRPAPLYPVYTWIPIPGAVKYEVEVLRKLPENPNAAAPSAYRIWSKQATGFDCYDDEPRNLPGIYYWRVRGLDAANRPVGVFSDVGQFTVELQKGSYAATLGDSITHGGGDISYSPANWQYDYQTYLSFPAVNLGKSGDTSQQILQRFSQDVTPYHPRYLIVLAGTNSLRTGVPASQVINDLQAIRTKCLTLGIRPVFLTLPPINPKAIEKVFQGKTVADWQQEFSKVNQFIHQQPYFIDIASCLADEKGELSAAYSIDGLHPGVAGKKIIAKVINDNWARVTQ